MSSDFATQAKAARQQLPVPAVPINAIRQRARAATARNAIAAAIVALTTCLLAFGAATGLAGKVYQGVQIWLSGSKAAVVVHSFALVREPMASDLQRAVQQATFPVVLPTALPAGTRMSMLMFAPKDHPNTITIIYKNRRGHFNGSFYLFDSSTANAGSAGLPTGSQRPHFHDVGYQWRVGRESVLVNKTALTAGEALKIRAAMEQSSPRTALDQSLAMVRKIFVLDDSLQLADVADGQAPVRSVLVGPRDLNQITRLKRQNKPILDTRTVYLSNIPVVGGWPDYTHATLHWPHTIVVSENGVRAISAVMELIGWTSSCSCEVLFNAPTSGSAYNVWVLYAPSGKTTKYRVDAKNFRVTR